MNFISKLKLYYFSYYSNNFRVFRKISELFLLFD